MQGDARAKQNLGKLQPPQFSRGPRSEAALRPPRLCLWPLPAVPDPPPGAPSVPSSRGGTSETGGDQINRFRSFVMQNLGVWCT